jgi:hypothetical protein
MIWSFTRGAAQIDVEVHRGADPDHYTLAVTYPDGAEQIEHFDKASKLVTRALLVQRRLIEDGWLPSSPANGQTIVPRRRRRLGHVRTAAAAARRTVVQIRRSITKRLAAAFGL